MSHLNEVARQPDPIGPRPFVPAKAGETEEEFIARLAAWEEAERERRSAPVTVGDLENAVEAISKPLLAIQELLEEALRSSWSVQRVR